jgi:hypothetical protein
MTIKENNLNIQLDVICNTADIKAVRITYDESIPVPTKYNSASALKEALRICKPEYSAAIPVFKECRYEDHI